jgi:hypothetical protein
MTLLRWYVPKGFWGNSIPARPTSLQKGCIVKVLSIEMPDGSKWAVPVEVIAKDRASNYAHEFDGDVERSLAEDTMPLFEDEYEVADWAANNMNWHEVSKYAFRIQDAPPMDFQEGWMNGAKSVAEVN